MPRDHAIQFLLLILGGSGCTIENPAFSLGDDAPRGSDSGGQASTGGPTEASGTAPTSASGEPSGSASDSASAADTDPTGAGASSSGGDPASTGGLTTATATGTSATTGDVSTGTADTTGAASTTGGDPACMDLQDGEPPRLAVKQDGQPLLTCAGAKTLTNAFAKFSGATLQLYDSGDCTQMGSVYEVAGVNFAIEPKDLGDSCTTARIEWAPGPVCEVTGFALAKGGQPVYVGAFGRLRGPMGYTAFAAAPIFDCGCSVDAIQCCEHIFELDQKHYQPGIYTLKFPGADNDIGPGETAQGTVGRSDVQFTNLRSQVRESCQPGPSNVWLDIRWWAMVGN